VTAVENEARQSFSLVPVGKNIFIFFIFSFSVLKPYLTRLQLAVVREFLIATQSVKKVTGMSTGIPALVSSFKFKSRFRK